MPNKIEERLSSAIDQKIHSGAGEKPSLLTRVFFGNWYTFKVSGYALSNLAKGLDAGWSAGFEHNEGRVSLESNEGNGRKLAMEFTDGLEDRAYAYRLHLPEKWFSLEELPDDPSEPSRVVASGCALPELLMVTTDLVSQAGLLKRKPSF